LRLAVARKSIRPPFGFEKSKVVVYTSHMRFVRRAMEETLAAAIRAFPAVVLTGPRRAGKTTLLRRLFPRAQYVLLEDPDVQSRSRSDPRGFLDELQPPVLFDEIQHVPDLLAYVRTKIDQKPRQHGQWIFTGSQEAPLMRGVTESMAGRAAIMQLLPFSITENDRVGMLGGGFPEALAGPKTRTLPRGSPQNRPVGVTSKPAS
jgi:predicted AAA+ superfamily ATPase